MNAELYLKKAVLQLAKGLEGKSIESLNKVLETGGDKPYQSTSYIC